GQLGKLVVQLVMHPSGEERHALEQPLHVRILAAIGLELEPACDLRVPLRELRAGLAQVAELPLVVGEQLVRGHQGPPCTTYCWVGSCRTVSKATGSGAGSTRSHPSTLKRRARSWFAPAWSPRVTRSRSSRGS